MKLGVANVSVVVFMLTIGACCATPPPKPVQTVVVRCSDEDSGGIGEVSDEASLINMGSPCAVSCRSLDMLGCPEAKKLEGGKTCYETCIDILPVSNYNTDCVVRAKTVDAVRKCPMVKCLK